MSGVGKKRITLREVAARAEVSPMAVSLAFKSDSKLADSTRKRILRIAAELNYVPNHAARQLRSGRSDLIGFVLNDPANPFHARMAVIAEEEFHAAGFTLFVRGTGWDPAREAGAIERFLRMDARGILLCSCEIPNAGWELLGNSGVPCAAIDSAPEAESFPAGLRFLNDCVSAGRMMAEHFAAVGVRRPAYISAGPEKQEFSAFAQLFGGFESRCAELGIPVRPEWREYGGLTVADGIGAFHRLAARGAEFDALFCVNDLCACGAVEAAESAGFRVGRDLAVAGIDDLEESALRRISLTSLRQPNEILARSAARALLTKVIGGPTAGPEFFLPELKIRSTTSNFERKTT